MVEAIKNTRVIHVIHQLGAGLDVHNQYVTACVAMKQGTTIEKIAVQEFPRTPKGLGNMCRFLGKHLLECITMEATGVYFPIVYKALETYHGWGGITPELIVINPSLVKKYPGELHSDKRDAIDLARLGLAGLARGSYVPTTFLQVLRSLTRELRFIDKDCTRLKNRIKRILSRWGLPLKDFDLNNAWALDLLRAILHEQGNFGKAMDTIENGAFAVQRMTKVAVSRRKAMYSEFNTITIPPDMIVSLESYLLALSFNASILTRLNERVEKVANQDPVLMQMVHRLSEIPGLTETSAISLIAEIGNIARFPNRRRFLKYVGCTMAQHDSGDTSIPGHLSQRVNKFARYHFCNAGKAVVERVKEDSDLKEFARKQRNAHVSEPKLTYTNTGIKIARIVYAIMRNNAAYQPFHDRTALGSKQHSDEPSHAESQHKKVVLQQLRKKTKHLVKYLEQSMGEHAGPWYQYLATLFAQLCKDKQEEAKEPPTNEEK